MNSIVKKLASLCLAAVMACSVFVMPASADTAADTAKKVGELLDGFTAGSGTFTVTADSRIFVASASEPTGELLQTAQLIQRQFKAQFAGCFEELVWSENTDLADKGDVVLCLDSASGTGADGLSST